MKFKKWQKLMTSECSGERTHAADELPEDATEEEVVPYLITCLRDPHALVRTCAADTLRECAMDEVQQALREAVSIEEDSLAKAYVLSSLGAGGDLNDLAVLAEALKSETDPQIQIRAALGLALCASNIAITKFLAEIKAGEPMRNTAGNIISDYMDAFFQWHMPMVTEVVKEQLDKESLSLSERECLSDLYKRLKKIKAG